MVIDMPFQGLRMREEHILVRSFSILNEKMETG